MSSGVLVHLLEEAPVGEVVARLVHRLGGGVVAVVLFAQAEAELGADVLGDALADLQDVEHAAEGAARGVRLHPLGKRAEGRRRAKGAPTVIDQRIVGRDRHRPVDVAVDVPARRVRLREEGVDTRVAAVGQVDQLACAHARLRTAETRRGAGQGSSVCKGHGIAHPSGVGTPMPSRRPSLVAILEPGEGAMRVMAARLLIFAGVGLLVWCATLLGWRRLLDLEDEPPEPESPPLVLRGPFGIVRHPQTLALLFLLAGAGLRWPRPGLWVPALVAATIAVALALAEEPRMLERFGEAFRRYQRAVPFLFPRLLLVRPHGSTTGSGHRGRPRRPARWRSSTSAPSSPSSGNPTPRRSPSPIARRRSAPSRCCAPHCPSTACSARSTANRARRIGAGSSIRSTAPAASSAASRSSRR